MLIIVMYFFNNLTEITGIECFDDVFLGEEIGY